MPYFRRHTLLQIVWVRAVPKHFLVVVRFEKDGIALREIVDNCLIDNANIGHHANFMAIGFDHKAARVRSIVALAEGAHLNAENIANIAWTEIAHLGWAELAARVVERFSGEVERQTEPLSNAVGAADVVGVLVRDKHSPDLANIDARRLCPLNQSVEIDTRVNQHRIALISNIIAITITSRSQSAYLYHLIFFFINELN